MVTQTRSCLFMSIYIVNALKLSPHSSAMFKKTNVAVARSFPALQRLCHSSWVRLSRKPKTEKKMPKDGANDEFDIGVPIKGKQGS